MYFAVIAIDKPGSPGRERLGAAHRAYLDSQPLAIFAGGPLLADDGECMLGSLLIIECASRAEVDDFLDAEPFNQAGLYAEVRVQRWDRRR